MSAALRRARHAPAGSTWNDAPSKSAWRPFEACRQAPLVAARWRPRRPRSVRRVLRVADRLLHALVRRPSSWQETWTHGAATPVWSAPHLKEHVPENREMSRLLLPVDLSPCGVTQRRMSEAAVQAPAAQRHVQARAAVDRVRCTRRAGPPPQFRRGGPRRDQLRGHAGCRGDVLPRRRYARPRTALSRPRDTAVAEQSRRSCDQRGRVRRWRGPRRVLRPAAAGEDGPP
jgi:hypothetical protein